MTETSDGEEKARDLRPLADSDSGPSSTFRERLFHRFKTDHPNLRAIYMTISVILVWHGIWHISGTWAEGGEWFPGVEYTPLFTTLRYGILFVAGIALLWIDDQSLEELVLQSKASQDEDQQNRWEKMCSGWKKRFPNLTAIYTVVAILLVWSGIWGLIDAVPIAPFWKALGTSFLGFFLLYIDDFRLDELT